MSSYASPHREHSASAKDRVVVGESGGGSGGNSVDGWAGRLAGRMAGRLAGRMAGRLAGRKAGRLAGRMAGKRAGSSGAVGSRVDVVEACGTDGACGKVGIGVGKGGIGVDEVEAAELIASGNWS